MSLIASIARLKHDMVTQSSTITLTTPSKQRVLLKQWLA
jgi:hypothetical protein